VRKCSNQREARIQPNKMALNIFWQPERKVFRKRQQVLLSNIETGINMLIIIRLFTVLKPAVV
jgi:hypothetical protein